MPLYDYKCSECGKILHAKHSMRDKRNNCSEISECEKSSSIEKIMSLSLSTTSGKEEVEHKSYQKDTSSLKNQRQLAEKVERHIEFLREESKQTKKEVRQNNTFSKDQALKIAKGK